MTSDQPARFIPPGADEENRLTAPWGIFASRAYFRLWIAQMTSSTGDWVGLIAIVAIASRISHNSGAAVSLVMVARVLPGFFLGTVGGVIIDRFDRRRVMVVCDIGRAALLAILAFSVDTLFGLVMISFGLEILTLLWGPAKDASVPHLVEPDRYTAANTLSLIASFATFPLASVAFSLLTALSTWLGGFHALGSLRLNEERLALLVDALTFLVSALIVFRLPIPHERERQKRGADWMQTWHDIREGLGFIASHPRIRGVIVGIGVGVIGGAAMVPLGPVFAKQALGGDSATFGVLATALGFGAAAGVLGFLGIQKRVNREAVFEFAVMGTGIFLVIGATFSSLGPSALFIGLTGACAGTSYVTGFTVLQEQTHDDLRGRTFASLYTVIRLCMLISLVTAPLWADFWKWFVRLFMKHNTISLAGGTYAFSGARLALWAGGVITLAGGWFARHTVIRAHRDAAAESA